MSWRAVRGRVGQQQRGQAGAHVHKAAARLRRPPRRQLQRRGSGSAASWRTRGVCRLVHPRRPCFCGGVPRLAWLTQTPLSQTPQPSELDVLVSVEGVALLLPPGPQLASFYTPVWSGGAVGRLRDGICISEQSL
jgi:hypothetical protein